MLVETIFFSALQQVFPSFSVANGKKKEGREESAKKQEKHAIKWVNQYITIGHLTKLNLTDYSSPSQETQDPSAHQT